MGWDISVYFHGDTYAEGFFGRMRLFRSTELGVEKIV